MPLPKAPQRTSPSFAFSTLARATRESLGERKFGRNEMDEANQFFNSQNEPECVYCGTTDVHRWDHIVPIIRGGDTVLGNMVLACATCDDSKQASDFETWMNGNAAKFPGNRGVTDISLRVRKIHAYARKHKYEAREFAQRLDKAELAELKELQNQVAEARLRLEQLASNYQARVSRGES